MAIRLILVALLLWVPPATAACELACASEQGHSTPSAAEAGHEHHHEQEGAHHTPAEENAGCCCISQSFASNEVEVRTLTHHAGAMSPVAAPTVVASRTTARLERGDRSHYARPPFADRVRPLLI